MKILVIGGDGFCGIGNALRVPFVSAVFQKGHGIGEFFQGSGDRLGGGLHQQTQSPRNELRIDDMHLAAPQEARSCLIRRLNHPVQL